MRNTEVEVLGRKLVQPLSDDKLEMIVLRRERRRLVRETVQGGGRHSVERGDEMQNIWSWMGCIGAWLWRFLVEFCASCSASLLIILVCTVGTRIVASSIIEENFCAHICHAPDTFLMFCFC